ncbi:serine/threonine-protein kinase 11-interacting protein, partial [Clarias magur]
VTLCHQKDIKKLESFQEQMGKDWLCCQRHLHGMPAIISGPRPDRLIVQVIPENNCAPSPPPAKTDCTTPRLDSLTVPLLSIESKREEEEILICQLETESTLQCTGHSFVETESPLEIIVGDSQPPEKANIDPACGEEDDLG